MATVYLAEHPRISKRVAVKVIHNDLASSPEMVSRFLAEAKAASQINHEHVVDILDFGQTPSGDNFMIMEYLDGQTLSQRVRGSGKLDVGVAMRIGHQIAEALIPAHQQGVVHRDLKPDNIFLIKRQNNPDFVKILDFGLAKLLTGSEGLQHRTSSGSVLGTPHYMAPEQCEGRISVDGRADLYSLGCILFHMVTGGLPFPGDGFAEVILKHLSEMAPNPRSMNPLVTPAVDKLILHCLAKNRDYRFQTAEELLTALADPERWSTEFGDDPNKILGPRPGKKGKAQGPQSAPPQMATMMGEGYDPADSLANSSFAGTLSTGGASELPPIAAGTNMAPPRPQPIKPMAPPEPAPAAMTRIVPGTPPAPPPPAGASPLPPYRQPMGMGRAPSSNPQMPPPMEIPAGASSSQLASAPVVARAAPQMATMIGEMPAAAISALAQLAPPSVNSAVASSSGVMPVPPSDSGRPRSVPQMAALPSQNERSGGDWNAMQQMQMQMQPSQPYPQMGSGAGYAAVPSSNPGYPSYPPMQGQMGPAMGQPMSQPMMGGPGQSQSMLPPSAATPQSKSAARDSKLMPIVGRIAKKPWSQAFLSLPPEKRLLILRVSAAGFAVFGVLLLLLLLWPKNAEIVVRSEPDQAEVVKNGESLGTTPVVVELKKGTSLKLVLRKPGYDDALEEIKANGEKVVLVTLSEKGSAKPKPLEKTPPPEPPVVKKNGQKPPPAVTPPPPVTPPPSTTPTPPPTAAPDEGDSGDDKPEGGDDTKKKKKKKKKKVVVF